MKLYYKGEGDAAAFYTPSGQTIVDRAGTELSDSEAEFLLNAWPDQVELKPETAESPKGEHDA